MKKLISPLLAALTVFALSTAAFAASMGGVVKPNKNGDNTVTFGNDNVTYAKLSFKADSDAEKFYIELSTDWDDCAYGADFYDLDACLYAFTVNPSIPAASAPTLLLYNRFVDEDGELTIDPRDVTIYQVKKTGLTDVTVSFTATETGDGDPIFAIRTRTPGTYVISAQKLENTSGALSPRRVTDADRAREEKATPEKQASKAAASPGAAPWSKAVLPSFAKK